MRRIALLSIAILLVAMLVGSVPTVPASSEADLVARADGTVVRVTLEPGVYVATASGSYTYNTSAPDGSRDADAQCTGFGTSPEMWQDYGTHVLSLLVRVDNGEWDEPWKVDDVCDTATHTYATQIVCNGTCVVEFYIHDTFYRDNAGSIAIRVEGSRWPLVSADGSIVHMTLSTGNYGVRASGLWSHGSGDTQKADALCETQDGLTWVNGGRGLVFSVWGGPFKPFFQGVCDDILHTYDVYYTCEYVPTCHLRVRIEDGWHGDNQGSLVLWIAPE